MDSTEHVSIAGYVRVSGLQQVKFGSSLPEQRKAIETYARAYGYTIYQIYADEGFSGVISDRPALTRMKEDAQKGLFQKVVFTCLDRFGRSASDALSDYTYFEELGISLHSIREELDTSTPLGRFIRTILAGIAEMERERMLERTIIGRLARISKGLRIAPGPFGYSWNEKKRAYQIHPEESDIYRRIVHDYLLKGRSQRQIALGLNNDGIKSRFGKKWSQKVVACMLYNPAYKGCGPYVYQGRKFDIKYPPLIDPYKWDEIQKRARENIGNVHRHFGKHNPFILENLLQCAECQCGIYPYRRKNRIARYYICHSHHPKPINKKGPVLKSCSLPRISAYEIENQVLNELVAYFQLPENILKAQSKQIDPSRSEEVRNRLERNRVRLHRLEVKKNDYSDLYNNENIDKEELKKQEDDLKASIRYVEEQVALNEKESAAIQARDEKMNNRSMKDIDLAKIGRITGHAFGKMEQRELKDLLGAAFGENKLTVRHVHEEGIPRKTTRMALVRTAKSPDDLDGPGLNNSWVVEGIEGIDFNAASDYLNLFIFSKT